jgi:hypothetical protein
MTASHQMLSSSGQTAGTVRTAWLTPHGRQSWTAISSILSGCTCAWADLDGFHCEPAPAGPPLATHLWPRHGRRARDASPSTTNGAGGQYASSRSSASCHWNSPASTR